MKKTATSILFLFLTAGLFAQYEGEITGKVIDGESKESIPSAYLTLKSNSNLVMQTQSDGNGVYTLKPLQPGFYDLFVSAFGYDTVEYNHIEVTTRGLTFQILELKSGISLGPIYVTTPLIDKQDPTVITTVKAEDFKHRAIDNIVDVAKQAPAVYDNEKTGGLNIGGSREDATLYVVDGIKVIGSLYLPMNAIKSINVITGGIPANYGDVTGGIVEIFTKDYIDVN